MKKYIILAAIGAFIATSCKQSEIQQQFDPQQGEPIEVALTLPLDQSQAVSRAEAQTSSWNEGAIGAELVTAPIDNPQSKAVADATVANVWVLQFDGTVDASKLIYKLYIPTYTAGSTVQLLKATTDNRVAIVANTFDAAWANAFVLNTATWATVSAATKAVTAQSDVLRPSGGTDYLPMSGSSTGTLAVGGTLNVPLIRTVVKVVVNLKSGTDLNATAFDVQLCNVPTTTSWFPDTGAGLWPASTTVVNYASENVTGITTTTYKTLTYWLPVNRRGTKAGTTGLTRATNAPEGATYLKVVFGLITYTVHLGGDFATDYNLKGNTAYSYNLIFQTDPAQTDSRVSDQRTLGALTQTPANNIAAVGATVTVKSPSAMAGLVWSGSMNPAVGYGVGAFSGAGPTGSVPVTVLVNPTNAVRSSVFTATSINGKTASLTISQAASTMGTLTQTPVNNIVAAGAVVTITTPGATAGLAWTAALSNTTGFTLGSVTGSGTTGSVPVTVALNPTNAVRSSILTATATGGNTAGTVTISQAASTLTSASASATTPVAYTATSVTFTVTGTSGLTLSFAKSSGDADFSVPADLMCDGTAQTITVTMAANTGAAREAAYTASVTNPGTSGLNLSGITVKQAKAKVPQPANSIEIGELYWATGNLVASGSNSCKIGAPTDYGVYFQFGSLVGWNGGANGNGVGTGSPALGLQVKPTGYGGGIAWTTVGYYKDGTTSDKLYNLPADAPTTGIGDACRYYLGAPWRTPTAAEYLTLLGASGANTNKGVPLKLTSYDLSFPASGIRNSSNGAFSYVGSRGYSWSSSVFNATIGYYLYFDSGSVSPQDGYNRSLGMPVRCVASS